MKLIFCESLSTEATNVVAHYMREYSLLSVQGCLQNTDKQ